MRLNQGGCFVSKHISFIIKEVFWWWTGGCYVTWVTGVCGGQQGDGQHVGATWCDLEDGWLGGSWGVFEGGRVEMGGVPQLLDDSDASSWPSLCTLIPNHTISYSWHDTIPCKVVLNSCQGFQFYFAFLRWEFACFALEWDWLSIRNWSDLAARCKSKPSAVTFAFSA